jgi:hypothetical protein
MVGRTHVHHAAAEVEDVVLGMSLAERLTCAGAPRSRAGRSERARRRLERWKADPSFSGDSSFERRLAGAGTDEQTLLALLDDDARSLAGRLTALLSTTAESGPPLGG